MRYTWVSGLRKSNIFMLPKYWMNSPFISSHPYSIILYLHTVMVVPAVAMVKIYENDLWMNSFLVKLQDLKGTSTDI